VGVILYEAVTGKLPFDGFSSFNDLLFKIALEEPPPPRTHVPDLDPQFERIVMKAMARESARRYDTVQDLNDALEEWATERDVPLSVHPHRTPRRISIPDAAVPPRALETQMETVTSLPGTAERERIGSEPTIQEDALGAASSQSLRGVLTSKKRIAIIVGAPAALLVVVALALAASSGSKPARPVGITPTAAAASVDPVDAASVLLPLASAAPEPSSEPEGSDPPASPASAATKPSSPLVPKRSPSKSPPTKPSATAAPKASSKPVKPAAPDFGY
jgi:eukaryotic-like serine/threonine-protein kinase